MKKVFIYFVLIISLLFVVTGCGKEEESLILNDSKTEVINFEDLLGEYYTKIDKDDLLININKEDDKDVTTCQVHTK